MSIVLLLCLLFVPPLGCGLLDSSDVPPPPATPSTTGTPDSPTAVQPIAVGDDPTRNEPAGNRGGTNRVGTEPAAPCPDQAAPSSGPADASVQWSDVQTVSGCFYFSGPDRLGRDDTLGDRARFEADAAGASLSWGRARFEGASTPDIRLARTSMHDYEGAWRVSETIEGRWVTAATRHYLDTPCVESLPRVIEATYRYHEYAPGTSTAGQCTIVAKVTLRFAR